MNKTSKKIFYITIFVFSFFVFLNISNYGLFLKKDEKITHLLNNDDQFIYLLNQIDSNNIMITYYSDRSEFVYYHDDDKKCFYEDELKLKRIYIDIHCGIHYSKLDKNFLRLEKENNYWFAYLEKDRFKNNADHYKFIISSTLETILKEKSLEKEKLLKEKLDKDLIKKSWEI